jgi:hypothetical protein
LEEGVRNLAQRKGGIMLEKIKTFFGIGRGRGRVIVKEGALWHCTKCKMIFVTKQAGEKHECDEKISVSS